MLVEEEDDNDNQKKYGYDQDSVGKQLGPSINQYDQENRCRTPCHGPGKALGVVSATEYKMMGIEPGGWKE